MELIKEIDWSKPIQMRNGTKLHLVTTNCGNTRYPVICLELNEDGLITDTMRTYTKEGFYSAVNTNSNNGYDAINVPEEVEEDFTPSLKYVKETMHEAVSEFCRDMESANLLRKGELLILIRESRYLQGIDKLRGEIDNL